MFFFKLVNVIWSYDALEQIQGTADIFVDVKFTYLEGEGEGEGDTILSALTLTRYGQAGNIVGTVQATHVTRNMKP